MLSGEWSAQRTLVEFFGNILFGDDLSEFSTPDSSSDFEDLSRKLKSSDGDDLSLDIGSINKNSFVINDIDDGGKFSFKRTEVDSGNSTNFYEFIISLDQNICTIDDDVMKKIY